MQDPSRIHPDTVLNVSDSEQNPPKIKFESKQNSSRIRLESNQNPFIIHPTSIHDVPRTDPEYCQIPPRNQPESFANSLKIYSLASTTAEHLQLGVDVVVWVLCWDHFRMSKVLQIQSGNLLSQRRSKFAFERRIRHWWSEYSTVEWEFRRWNIVFNRRIPRRGNSPVERGFAGSFG